MQHDDTYRLAVEQVRDYAIFVVGLDGRMASWNAGVRHVLGWEEAEWIGQPYAVLFPQEEAAAGAAEAELERARRDGRAEDDRWHVRKDGTRFWASGITTALRDEAGRSSGFLKLMRDLTDRKRAEERQAIHLAVTTVLAAAPGLAEAVPTLLEAICRTSGWPWGALWVIDPTAGRLRLVATWSDRERPLRAFEEASRAMTFGHGEGLPGRTWATNAPQLIASTFHEHENFPRREVATDAELHGALCFPVSWGGAVHGVMEFFSSEIRPLDAALLGTMSSVAGQIGQFIERRLTRDRLQASEARRAASVEAALDCIVSMDHRGLVTEWNTAAEQTFGYTRDEAIGRELAELIVPPSVREAHRAGVARHLATGESRLLSRRLQLTAMARGGRELPVELTIIRLPGEGPPAFTGFVRDLSEQQRIEEARRLSEARFQRLVEQSPLSTQIFGPDGHIRQVNAAWTRLWGITPEDLPGYDVRTDPRLAPVRHLVERAFAGEPVTIEPFPYVPDRGEHAGVPRWCGAHVYPIKDAAGSVEEVVFVHDDVTERKQAEDALARAKADAERHLARWEAVFESITEGLVLAGPDGGILSMNAAALAIHEFRSSDEMVTRLAEYPALFELSDLGGQPLTLDAWPISRVLRGERFAGYEVRVRRRDTGRTWIASYGGTPVLDASGRQTLGVLTLRDVTDRERAAAALTESEAKFRQLAETMPQLAWIARADGHLVWYNRRWYEYTGTTAEQMEGWGWQSVHDPAFLPLVLERWRASIATGQPFEMELPLRGADGVLRPFLTRVAPLRDASGRVVQWFGTNTDVTEQRRAAEEREHLLASERAARQEAERASRIKDEFLATLSHELRTPLNAVLGWAQLLSGDRARPDDLKKGLATIERNARAQARIIDDLLDMSRIVSGTIRLDVDRVELAALVTAALQAIAPAAEAKAIHVDAAIAGDAGPVVGDAARLQQVLWNLLTNAVKFTPKGGRIEVVLRRVASAVELRVTDTGEGIAPEFLPFVFDRFRQADASSTRRHGGLGLGLSIVKQLVELHGGTVEATSAGAGRGATFVVSLPVPAVHPDAAPRAAPADPASADGPSPAGVGSDLAGVDVLVVDDEPDARDVVQRVLERSGARVRTAGSAAEAMARIVDAPPGVLVCDVGMPDEDGHALMRRVRALPPPAGDVAAVALTAYARPEDRDAAVRAGFQVHVPKPVHADELLATVARLARR